MATTTSTIRMKRSPPTVATTMTSNSLLLPLPPSAIERERERALDRGRASLFSGELRSPEIHTHPSL